MLKTESDALEYLREIINLCHQQGKLSILRLSCLIKSHKRKCFKQACECHGIFYKGYVSKAAAEVVTLNFDAYVTAESFPQRFKNLWKLRALKILLYELAPLCNATSGILHMCISEITFYYLANYLQALSQAEYANNLSIVCTQRIINLRKTMENSLYKYKTGKASTLTALTFQEKYSEFLEMLDLSCEYTAKFWVALLENPPDLAKMMQNGKALYDSKEKLLSISQYIISTTNNHTEFLVKLGVYMKWIAHDKSGATKIFHKIQLACDDSSLMFLSHMEKFSVLRSENHVGMLTVSLESKDFFAIKQINYEVEQCLGYKKEELINNSAHRLMPAIISTRHQGFVRQFMETMDGKYINKEAFGFIKRQNGFIVPCQMLKKIVPSLSKGLQGIIFFYEDKAAIFHTSSKTDPTKRKVSAFDSIRNITL